MKHFRIPLFLTIVFSPLLIAQPRRVIDLGGSWEIAEGSMDRTPERFDHTVPVPGLADMAEPPFRAVGVVQDQMMEIRTCSMQFTSDFHILRHGFQRPDSRAVTFRPVSVIDS